jgi:hypothetical protein
VTLVADSKTDNTTAFQELLNKSAGKLPVRIGGRGSLFYKLTGRVTAPAHTHIILEDGAELRWTSTTDSGSAFLGSATRPGIEMMGDDFVIEGKGILRGPSVDAYVPNECAVFARGASSAARKRGLAIRGAIEIVDWGSHGVLAQFVDDISMADPLTHIHGIGYAGAMFISCNRGRVRHVQVGDIAPGTAGNAYGISLSHDCAATHRTRTPARSGPRIRSARTGSSRAAPSTTFRCGAGSMRTAAMACISGTTRSTTAGCRSGCRRARAMRFSTPARTTRSSATKSPASGATVRRRRSAALSAPSS